MKYISLPKAYSEHNSYIYERTSFTTQVEGGPCKRDLKECQKCFHACIFLILYIGEKKKKKKEGMVVCLKIPDTWPNGKFQRKKIIFLGVL